MLHDTRDRVVTFRNSGPLSKCSPSQALVLHIDRQSLELIIISSITTSFIMRELRTSLLMAILGNWWRANRMLSAFLAVIFRPRLMHDTLCRVLFFAKFSRLFSIIKSSTLDVSRDRFSANFVTSHSPTKRLGEMKSHEFAWSLRKSQKFYSIFVQFLFLLKNIRSFKSALGRWKKKLDNERSFKIIALPRGRIGNVKSDFYE